jgi:PAS domain S-box-containing protein
MNVDTFTQDLQAVRARGDRFAQRARAAVEGEALLPEALEELSTALEELRVTEEEIRVQREQLVEGRQSLEAERDGYRELFDLAPVAYLVTDRVGVITEANRRAASLLGIPQHFLVGRPLAMFVAGQDKQGLRDRLNQLGGLEFGSWQLHIQPRQCDPVQVVVSTSVARNQAGQVVGLRWALVELPAASDQVAQGDGGRGQASAALVTSRPAGQPALAGLPSPAPDSDSLALALQRLVRTAVPLLRVDGTGLMLANHQGALDSVTGTDQAGQAFEAAQRDLGEGPCIDAFTSGGVVATEDLRADPRWPRLGPAARTNQIRGILVAPVLRDGRAIGTCNALSFSPRTWTHSDLGAIRAYADMLSQLIGSASDARHQGALAAQLQVALASRVLIEQAKGVLMERHGLDDQAAFTRLRRQARSSSRKLADVARQLIGDHRQEPDRAPSR